MTTYTLRQRVLDADQHRRLLRVRYIELATHQTWQAVKQRRMSLLLATREGARGKLRRSLSIVPERVQPEAI